VKPLIVFKTVSFPTISETFIVSNIVETIKKGFKVKIIVDTINSNNTTSQPDLLAQYGLLELVSMFQQPTEKKARYIKAFRYLLNPVLFYYFIKYSLFKGKNSLSYIFILNFYSKYRDVAAYHVHFATAIHPLIELKAIGFLKSKIVVTFHGYDAHFLPKDEQQKILIDNFNKYVSHITVNSQFLKDKLVEKGFIAKNIKIIPIGISTDFFNSNTVKEINSKLFKMITVGRLVELKGQAFGIKTVKILKEKGYEVSYSIIGSGKELATLKQLVKELNLIDSIHFYGSQKQGEIKELLKEQDLFLMTSTIDKDQRREAFGVVSLEAQAMGLPVVGFKSGGFPETLIEGETGITVKDKDVEALANVILDLIEDNDKMIAMSTAAKKHIKENFDTSIITAKYLDLYS
jgi:colanic acid/amylovoran biosynthesis glycosyltransferase